MLATFRARSTRRWGLTVEAYHEPTADAKGGFFMTDDDFNKMVQEYVERLMPLVLRDRSTAAAERELAIEARMIQEARKQDHIAREEMQKERLMKAAFYEEMKKTRTEQDAFHRALEIISEMEQEANRKKGTKIISADTATKPPQVVETKSKRTKKKREGR